MMTAGKPRVKRKEAATVALSGVLIAFLLLDRVDEKGVSAKSFSLRTEVP
jgi:hypothetical protein